MLLTLPPELISHIQLPISATGRLRCASKRFKTLGITRTALLDLFSETPNVGEMSTEALEAAAKRFFDTKTSVPDTSVERTIMHIGFLRHSLRAKNIPLWPSVSIEDLVTLYDAEFGIPPRDDELVISLLRARSTLLHTKRGRNAILTLVAYWAACTDNHPEFFRSIAECIKSRRIVNKDGNVVV